MKHSKVLLLLIFALLLGGNYSLAGATVDTPDNRDAQAGGRDPLLRSGGNSGFLTGPNEGEPLEIALEYLDKNRASLGLTSDDLADVVVTDQYTSQHNGVTHIYLRQRHGGIEVFDANLNINIAADGSVINVGHSFVAELAKVLNTTRASLSASNAVQSAAQELNLEITEPLSLLEEIGGPANEVLLSDGGISLNDIPVKLMYQSYEKEVRLAWNVSIYELDAQNWWHLRIDAQTSQLLDKNNWVIQDYWGQEGGHDHASPTESQRAAALATCTATGASDEYCVYAMPLETPNHGNRSMQTDPADSTASPYGWHDTNGATGAESNYTVGNNVDAYQDTNDSNGPTGGNAARANGGANRVFNFDVDLTQQPSTYQDAAITNLFYWNNTIHDVFYRYGFDEASGNFQENNYGKGGSGSDSVNAEAQDGGGTNNANFATPPDGGNPRMQMYLWTQTSPGRDGDFDNGIIIHEYGHGISIRLTGGPSNSSCLSNSEQGGEGWSDWFGLMMSMKAGDAGPDKRGIGTYVLGQSTDGDGIRPAPYSTNTSINNYTYGNIGSLAAPHGVGFVWATMLWEMNWALIDQHGFDPDIYSGSGGNNIAMQLVMDGLKLQPCSPGFVDARNAILQADQTNNAGANQCLIWEAFAKRGLGYSANQGSSGSNTDGTEAFDMPPLCEGLVVTPETQNICVGDTASYTVSLGQGFTPPVTMSATGQPAGSNATFSPNPVMTAPSDTTLTIGNSGGATAGSHTITIMGTAGSNTSQVTADLNVSDGNPGALTLSQPAGGATAVSPQPTFEWNAASGALSYDIEIATDSGFSNVVYSATVNSTSHTPTSSLGFLTTYYWRVRAANGCGNGSYSSAFSFTTSDTSLVCNGAAVDFESGIPADWSVEDNSNGAGIVWGTTADSACGIGNLTNGSGAAACADSDAAGSGAPGYDTELVTPAFNLSGFNDATLNVAAYYRDIAGDSDKFEIDIWNGSSWNNLLSWNEDHQPEDISLDLSAYAGQTGLQIRFRYSSVSGWDWYTQVDDVALTCTSSQAPRIAVNPASLPSTQGPNQQNSETVVISNPGTADLTWTIQEDQQRGAASGAASIESTNEPSEQMSAQEQIAKRQALQEAFLADREAAQDLDAMSATACVNGMAGSYPCNNVDLLAFMPLAQIGGGEGNDIWGWTDLETGKEYAIMGRTSGTSFVDISDPENPVYLGNLPTHTANSNWRDLKVYNNHAFIVSEASGHGMQIFDLTQLRTVNNPPVPFSNTAHYGDFGNAHNIVINEQSGFAYAVGTTTCGAGLHMVNISTPANPTNAGCFSSDGYTHDAQCVMYHGPDTAHQGQEVCFNSNEDTLTIVDVSNKNSPTQLSRTGYNGSSYTHQGWLTEDHAYFLLDDETDERNNGHNTYTYIWDVSDLDSPSLIGTYNATTAAIDHNLYIKGQHAYQSNYRAGLRILDVSDISNANLTETAYFDIYPSSDSASFNGTWSNYPYFESGVVIVSGIEQGLFILQPNLDGSPPPPPPAEACDTPSDISWASVSPTSGTTAPSGNSSVNVTFDSTGLASGTYTGTLCINSNDPVTPLVTLPLTLIVESGPTTPTPTPTVTNTPTHTPTVTPTPTNTPTPTQGPVTISDVRTTNVRDVAFTVSWLTDVATSGEVHYGTNPNNLNQTAEDLRGASTSDDTHYVLLEHLSPETTYYFDVVSGSTTDDNRGSHYSVTTGGTLSVPSTDTVFGQVRKSDGTTPAAGAIVYITLKDGNSSGTSGQAAPLSALVANDGFWNTNLGNARTENVSAYFSYSASGDQLFLEAQGAADGEGCQSVDTSADNPAATVELGNSPCTISSDIELRLGWNKISLAVQPTSPITAESLCAEIDSIVEIDRFINGGWQGHICGQPFNNFTLGMNSGYFIKSDAVATWSVEALPVSSSTLHLEIGWNSISLPHTDGYMAETLCDEIIAQGVMAVEIDRWDAGGWEGHICGQTFNDFAINPGEGYFVKTSSAGTVTPPALAALSFGQPPEESLPEVGAAMPIRDLVVSNLRDTSLTLSWTTEEATTGYVRIGEGNPSTSSGHRREGLPLQEALALDIRGANSSSRTHAVLLDDLAPETTYQLEVISGADGTETAQISVTTGPTLESVPSSDTIYGKIFEEADGVTPATGALVQLTIIDGDGAGSDSQAMPLVAIVDAEGDWHANLGNARTAALDAYFDYSPQGDQLLIEAQGADGRTATETVEIPDNGQTRDIIMTASTPTAVEIATYDAAPARTPWPAGVLLVPFLLAAAGWSRRKTQVK
ncbi:MAG: choice-of-anchor B family protein [Ardenticatenaceae bacterium]